MFQAVCSLATQLGGKIDYGINWVWITGLTQDGAKKFVTWLDKHEVDNRGVYPPVGPVGADNGYSVRFRV